MLGFEKTSARNDPKTFLMLFSLPPALLSPRSRPTLVPTVDVLVAAGESHPAVLAFHSLPPTPGDVTAAAGPPHPPALVGATSSVWNARDVAAEVVGSVASEYDWSELLVGGWGVVDVVWKPLDENVDVGR